MALALKYRPKRFEDLIGQDAISQTLRLALKTKNLSHAYLFSGLRGSGKTSTARILSKCLICDEGPTPTPCERCDNCKAANEGRHIDIIEMDAASNRKIDDIRELIEQTKYKPSSARYKIFIIDEVHMLTKEAFNALLKTLEEPPEYVKFILATTDPLKLPPTILSRTQHFRFKKISQHDIVHHLEFILNKERVPFEPQALQILARSGGGSLRDTLTLLDQAIVFSKGYVDIQSVTKMLGLVDPQRIEELFELILSKDKESLIQIVQELQEYEARMILDEMIAYLKEQLFLKNPKFSTLLYERFFKILSDAKSLLFFSGDDEFVLTITLLKLLEATKVKEIEELIAQFEEQIPTHPIQPSVSKPEPTPPKPSPQYPKEAKKSFATLIDRLYKRSYELGECFEKSVEFVEFRDGVLRWISTPPPECKEKLKHSYSTIRHLVQEIFGIDTKIQKVDPPKKCEEATSMIEEAEFGSCIQQEAGLNAPQPQSDILNEPLVQKAKELFKAKRVVVKPKI